jgi:hypothetical protein
MDERWVPVPGYDGSYEVSSFGRVRSVDRCITTRHGVRKQLASVLQSPWMNRDGYLRVGLCNDGVRQKYRVHTLVLLAFVGECPDGMECRHLDGCKTNNKLSNLKWGTHLENCEDMEKHGKRSRGENHTSAKLTKKQVVTIRKQRTRGETLASLSDSFGVSTAQIRRIVDGVEWRHV